MSKALPSAQNNHFMNENQTQKKVTVIYHRADFDGLFCRAIAKKFLPGAELIGWDHGDAKLPFPPEGVVYVLDLSPDCFETIPVPGGLRLVWIDHHESSIKKWDAPESGVITGARINGVAACRLAWQWFLLQEAWDPRELHPPGDFPAKIEFIERTVREPLAVRLAGEYDVWDKRDPHADIFQFGLRSRELSDLAWAQLLDDTVPDILQGTGMEQTESELFSASLLKDGYLLQRYQQERDASLIKRGFLVEFEGLTFLALNTAFCNSLTFAARDNPETGHDALLAYYFDGKQWKVSLYHARHNLTVDLSLIAARFGGGGHRGACGFHRRDIKVEDGMLKLLPD